MDVVIESKPQLVFEKFLEYQDENGNVSIKLNHLIIVLNNLEYKDVATGKRILFDNDSPVTMDSSQNVTIGGLNFKFNYAEYYSNRRLRVFGFLEKRTLKYLVIVPVIVWQNSDERIIETTDRYDEYPFTLYYQKDTSEEDLSVIRSVLSILLQEQLMLMVYLPIEPIIHPKNADKSLEKILKETYDLINSINTGFEGDANGTD